MSKCGKWWFANSGRYSSLSLPIGAVYSTKVLLVFKCNHQFIVGDKLLENLILFVYTLPSTFLQSPRHSLRNVVHWFFLLSLSPFAIFFHYFYFVLSNIYIVIYFFLPFSNFLWRAWKLDQFIFPFCVL